MATGGEMMKKMDLVYASKDALIQRYTHSVMHISCLVKSTFAKRGTFAPRGMGFIRGETK